MFESNIFNSRIVTILIVNFKRIQELYGGCLLLKNRIIVETSLLRSTMPPDNISNVFPKTILN